MENVKSLHMAYEPFASQTSTFYDCSGSCWFHLSLISHLLPLVNHSPHPPVDQARPTDDFMTVRCAGTKCDGWTAYIAALHNPSCFALTIFQTNFKFIEWMDFRNKWRESPESARTGNSFRRTYHSHMIYEGHLFTLISARRFTASQFPHRWKYDNPKQTQLLQLILMMMIFSFEED